MTVIFDNVSMAKRLEEGGFTRAQAEALAHEQVKVIGDHLAILQTDPARVGHYHFQFFNPIAYVHRMESVGFTREQAEVMAYGSIAVLKRSIAQVQARAANQDPVQQTEPNLDPP